jgi:hypothetical protein
MKGKPMRRREFIKAGAAGSVGLFAAKSLFAADLATPSPSTAENASKPVLDNDDALARGFQSPPIAAKPHTWWHWMDGNVARKGITADLEAMKRMGLGGVHIFNVAYQIPAGPVKYMSAEWRDMIHFAAQEGERLGLEVGMHNSPGWSSTGGPWITPDCGMQKVVWSELRLKGPVRFSGVIPKADAGKYADYYRDIAVIAYPAPAGDEITLRDARPKISTSAADATVDLDHPEITFPQPTHARPQFILFQFDEPFSARSLFLDYTFGRGELVCEVQISNDGREFKTIASDIFRAGGQSILSFPEAKARCHRILFSGAPADDTPFHIAGIDLLGGYRLPDWPAKAGFAIMDTFEPVWEEPFPIGPAYQPEQAVDLSALIQSDGKLEWDVPAGNWTIFRFGYAPNGRTNSHPENPAGYGLEVDKMNREALDLHFDKLIKVILEKMGTLAGKTFTTLLIDSYEVGSQNWTPRFREEFRQRNGYDLISYLPAFTGRIVDSTEITERFLWDVRRTIADLFADNYYGYFRELCRRNGLKAAFEPYGGPYAIMDCADHADLPMAEFWAGGSYLKSNSRNRLVISAGHLSGRAVVAAEAFTGSFPADRYTQDPYSLKVLGDFQFCEGVNRFIFHRFAHQGWLDQSPGMTMGPWGIHFDRTQTWWEPGRPWIEYLTRSQYLLQTGAPVADVLCFAGEDAHAQACWGENNEPPVPAGYDFEFINVTALLSATVEDDKIMLAGGLKFRALVLPDARYLSPRVAKKISALVKDGAIVIGPAPARSPGLANYPACDAGIRQIAGEIWGNCDGRTVTEHAFGRGKIFWGKSLEEILASLGVTRDFAANSADPEARICFKHRAAETTDIYFVSNQLRQPAAVECQFRVIGRLPELWHPETGIIQKAPIYQEADGHTALPMRLEPAESIFVIFRQAAIPEHVVSVTRKSPDHQITSAGPIPDFELATRDGAMILSAWASGDYEIQTAQGRTFRASAASLPAPMILNAGWHVSFPPKLGAPASIQLDELLSLSQHADPGVRYFSGTATYTRDFSLAAEALAPDRDFYLDLGVVKNIAEIKINDTDFGIVWKAPFRVCITPGLRAGRNRIEVRVTNLWANRLIGDEQLPDDCEWILAPGRGMHLKNWPSWLVENKPRPSQRIAFATWKFYDRNDLLLESGLIGPVKIHPVEKIRV